MKIDDTNWHLRWSFTQLWSTRQSDIASANIAIYLKWIIENGFEGGDLKTDIKILQLIKDAKESKILYTRLLDYLDGKLVSHMMNDQVAQFSEFFYDKYLEYLDKRHANIYGIGIESDFDYPTIKCYLDESYKTCRKD